MKGVYIMILDSAIKNFLEKYDSESMMFIDNISKDFGLNINGYTLPGFNIQETFDKFSKYIEGYCDYIVKNANNDKKSSDEIINESVNQFIDTQLFSECNLKYSELPSFVKSYTEGVKSLLETVNTVKDELLVKGFVKECANVNIYADKFMTKMDESFDPCMNKILSASGYTTKKAFKNLGKEKKESIQFI
jgi:hypothetical protein